MGYNTEEGFWFIRGGIGKSHHSNYMQFSIDQMPNPMNLLSDYEKSKIDTISNNGKTPVPVTLQIINNNTKAIYNIS